MTMCPPGSGGGCGAPAQLLSFFQGDHKPLSYLVTPSDLHVVGSATYAVLDANEDTFASGAFTCTYPPGPYLDLNNPPTSTLESQAIAWADIGTFIVRVVANWDDGQIDNSIWGLVTVYPLPTVGGC
jgi:hypothetical protein